MVEHVPTISSLEQGLYRNEKLVLPRLYSYVLGNKYCQLFPCFNFPTSECSHNGRTCPDNFIFRTAGIENLKKLEATHSGHQLPFQYCLRALWEYKQYINPFLHKQYIDPFLHKQYINPFLHKQCINLSFISNILTLSFISNILTFLKKQYSQTCCCGHLY